MNKKTLIVIISLLFVITIFALTKTKPGELELAECDLNDLAETPISFVIDRSILDLAYLDEIIEQINESLAYANQVLKNSCVPLKRSFGEIYTIDLDVDSVTDIYSAKASVANMLKQQGIDVKNIPEHEKYGLVINAESDLIMDYSGVAEMLFGAWFFAISSDASIETLEHELGHLAWAEHAEHYPTPNLSLYLRSIVPKGYHDNLKPYARAIRCGNAGTIMSYEEEILPVYSSPDIYYQGERCGDSNTADNARVLKEYANRLLENNAL